MMALLKLGAQAGGFLVQPTGLGALAVEGGLDRRAAFALSLELPLEGVGPLLEALELLGQRGGRRAERIRSRRLLGG
jgi:hypothetical protein